MTEKTETKEQKGELGAFQRLARALFGVDKRDVPKHVPTKRDKQAPQATVKRDQPK